MRNIKTSTISDSLKECLTLPRMYEPRLVGGGKYPHLSGSTTKRTIFCVSSLKVAIIAQKCFEYLLIC